MAKELYKYKKIYSGEGIYCRGKKKDASDKIRTTYGHENNGRKFIPFIFRYIKPSSVIDIGCGHNEFIQDIRSKKSIKAVGVDFACSSADVISSADKLPFENKSFDLLTSFDMLEHIPYEEINEVIKEFNRIANSFFIQISLRQSPSTIDGENLHPIVRSPEWWIHKIEEYSYGINMIMYCKGKQFVPRQFAKRLALWGTFL